MSWREQTGCFWKSKEDGPACPQVSPDSRRGLCRATSWHETTLLSTSLHWISHQTISTSSTVFPSPSYRLGEVQSVNKGYRFRSPLVCKSWNWAIPIICTKDCTFKTKHPGLPWWRSGWESACQCRGHGFEPWSGKIPHAMERLGPWATITEPARLEPVLRNKRGRDGEGPAHRDEEWPPLAATRESPHTETKTQHSHK